MKFEVSISGWRGSRSIVFNPAKNRVRVEVSTGCYGGSCDICQQRLREVSSWLRSNGTSFTQGKMFPKGSEHCIGYGFHIEPAERTPKSICDAISKAFGVRVCPC